MAENNFHIKGLSQHEILVARKKYGENRSEFKKESGFLKVVTSLAKEPMVILLLVTSAIYFVTGSPGDGIFLAVAIVLVSAISLYQDSRSRNALEKLPTSSRLVRDSSGFVEGKTVSVTFFAPLIPRRDASKKERTSKRKSKPSSAEQASRPL